MRDFEDLRRFDPEFGGTTTLRTASAFFKHWISSSSSSSSSSSCSGRISFDSCSLYPQNEIGLSLGRPMCLRPFGLYCSACLGILFVSILCTCCSHFSWYCFVSFTIFSAPVFSLIHWFFSLSSFVIPRRCLKNFICAASKRFPSLFFSTQASLPNFSAALVIINAESISWIFQTLIFIFAYSGAWSSVIGLTLRRRIKSHLLFAGIIRSSPFSPR